MHYHATIYTGFEKVKKFYFESYNDLEIKIQRQWSIFRDVDFDIRLKHSEDAFITIDASLKFLAKLPRKNELHVFTKFKDFKSTWCTNLNHVKKYLQWKGPISDSESIFNPKHQDEPHFVDIEAPECKEVERFQKLFDELSTRSTIFDPFSRGNVELISPVLVHAILEFQSYIESSHALKYHWMVTKPLLVSHKFVGHADFSLVVNIFDVIVTAIQNESHIEAIQRNFVQQRVARESLSSTVTNCNTTLLSLYGKEWRTLCDAALPNWLLIPSFGIVTNAAQWWFTKLVYTIGEDNSLQSHFYISNAYEVPYSECDENEWHVALQKLLQKIIEVLYIQWKAVPPQYKECEKHVLEGVRSLQVNKAKDYRKLLDAQVEKDPVDELFNGNRETLFDDSDDEDDEDEDEDEDAAMFMMATTSCKRAKYH